MSFGRAFAVNAAAFMPTTKTLPTRTRSERESAADRRRFGTHARLSGTLEIALDEHEKSPLDGG